MRDRQQLIRMHVQNGVTKLNDIKESYNSFGDGGDMINITPKHQSNKMVGRYFTKEINPTYQKYEPYIQKYIDRKQFSGTKLTGDDLAEPFSDYVDKHPQVNKDSLVKLMLVQAQQETHMGKDTVRKKPGYNNPYNIGEFDNKTTTVFNSPKEGVSAYLNNLDKNYFPRVNYDIDALTNNYVNNIGNRYASDPGYESKLKAQMQYIDKYYQINNEKSFGGDLFNNNIYN